MSTFGDQPYELPSTMFSEGLWMNWNLDTSSTTAHEENISGLDFTYWQPSIFSFPDCHSLPSDSWASQCTTPVSTPFPANPHGTMAQFPEGRTSVADWIPSSSKYTFSVPSPESPTSSLPCRNLAKQPSPPAENSSHHYFAMPQASSPSVSDSNPACSVPPTPSNNADTRRTHVSKSPIRCYEHSCGGRAFSSPGNYERHLREKSGRAKSFRCELCGQSFTRSTAKNKHVRFGRCRMRSAR